MIVILGKTASGKTTLVEELKKIGYKKLVTYTTRPIREEEKDGIDYHFISIDDFKSKEKDDFFAETTSYNASFGKCYYGTAKEDITDDKICIVNPYGFKSLLDKDIKINSIFLRAEDTILRRRLLNRGDSYKEIERRLKADRFDFNHIEDFVDLTLDIENFSHDFDELTKTVDFYIKYGGDIRNQKFMMRCLHEREKTKTSTSSMDSRKRESESYRGKQHFN